MTVSPVHVYTSNQLSPKQDEKQHRSHSVVGLLGHGLDGQDEEGLETVITLTLLDDGGHGK
jgi:hypothetical protein